MFTYIDQYSLYVLFFGRWFVQKIVFYQVTSMGAFKTELTLQMRHE